jgi:hypothetical protein
MSIQNILVQNDYTAYFENLNVSDTINTSNLTTDKGKISFSTSAYTISTQYFTFNSSTFFYKNNFDFGVIDMDWNSSTGNITVDKTGFYNFQFTLIFEASSFVSDFQIFFHLILALTLISLRFDVT